MLFRCCSVVATITGHYQQMDLEVAFCDVNFCFKKQVLCLKGALTAGSYSLSMKYSLTGWFTREENFLCIHSVRMRVKDQYMVADVAVERPISWSVNFRAKKGSESKHCIELYMTIFTCSWHWCLSWIVEFQSKNVYNPAFSQTIAFTSLANM